MNEENKDDLLSAFENPDTDPTPDIAPVMPSAAPVPEVQPNTVSMDNVMPPEFQNAPEAVPVEEIKKEINVSPIEPIPTVTVEPAPVAPNVTPVSEVKPAVTEDDKKEEEKPKDAEPSISVVQEAKNNIPAEEKDPKFMKKNIRFIAILFIIIIVFIFCLPKILEILGKGY